MPSSHLDHVEIVSGLVLRGKLSANAVDVGLLPHPYDQMIKRLREGEEKSSLMSELGFSVFSASMAAAEVAESVGDVDWISLLRSSYTREVTADLWTKAAKRLRDGKEPNTTEMRESLLFLTSGSTSLTRADEIDPSGAVWIETGWEPWDEHIGGVIEGGMTVLAGPPGTGKTSAIAKLMIQFLKKHPDKEAAIFSLEMTRGQILQRVLDIQKITKDERHRLWISDKMMDAEEIFAEATNAIANEKIGIVAIDFVDLIVRGETNVSTMSDTYKLVKWLAKESRVPVILLAQLNEKYTGGEPKINHLRWSRLAEALSDLIVLIYNPNQVISDQGKSSWLKTKWGSAYLIVGKSKWGTPHGGVGAVEMTWNGKGAWGDEHHSWVERPQE